MSMIHPGYNVTSPPNSKQGDPVWDVAFFYPPQGSWGENDYLRLDQAGGRIVELVGGCLEVLPMPTIVHQLLVKFLVGVLNRFVDQRKLGTVLFAPLPVHLGPKHYREPDIVFFRPERVPTGKEYPELADLVVEVVSDDAESRERDYVKKRAAYSAAGIPEYWIVDPQDQKVIVLALADKQYRLHGEFKPGTKATSALLPEFSIDVAELFAAAKV
jgi:Uma2 family endonuclease